MRDPMEIMEDRLRRFSLRLWSLYLRFNFCKDSFADGSPKPPSRLFDAYYAVFYLKCPCCAAARGMLAGLLLGFGLGYICT
jgi:hypothetical protein